jgi:predicted ArsR family transcriptional regulator
LEDAIATLRTALSAKSARTPRQPGAPRKPREGTRQQAVLALLRRPAGATVAQIAETTGWQTHTVRGFFAGLKKRQGITIEVAERVRPVGLGKERAKGSYTVCWIADAG